MAFDSPKRNQKKGIWGTNKLFIRYLASKYPLFICNQAVKRRAELPLYLSQELAPSLKFLLLLPRSHISQGLLWLPSPAQNWVLVFPGDRLPCHPCPGRQEDEDGNRVSDRQAITRTVPQGNGKDSWCWRLGHVGLR